MTTFFSNKTIQVLIGLAFAFVFFLIPQKSFAACELTHGQFRNVDYGIAFPLNWFSGSLSQNNNAQPYVYLDLKFSPDCAGQTISYEIQEGLLSLAVVDISYQLTSESLQQTSIFRAGGDTCIDDCEHDFWIEIDGDEPEYNLDSFHFEYACSDVCYDYEWQYVGTVYSTTQGYAYGSYKASNDPDFLASDDEQDADETEDDEQDSAFTPATISCGDKGCIENPLGDGSSLPAFVQSLLGIIIRAGIPIVVLALVYTGFRFVLARGNPEKISEAKHLLLWTVIGSAVVLGAWTIATILTNTINLIIS